MKIKVIIAGLLISGSVMAQTNAVFYDGVNFYSEGGGTSLNSITTGYYESLSIGNLTITTNGIAVTNNYGWNDLRFPVGVAAPVTPNADVVLDVANNAITFQAGGAGASTNFGTGANVDHVWGVAQFSHTWLTNSGVEPHVHFLQNFSDETNCWYMYYRWQALGDVTNSAWSFIGPAVNHYTFNGTSIHQMALFNIITNAGNKSSIMDWKIFANGAAVSNDLVFKEFDIHYQIRTPTGEQF